MTTYYPGCAILAAFLSLVPCFCGCVYDQPWRVSNTSIPPSANTEATKCDSPACRQIQGTLSSAQSPTGNGTTDGIQLVTHQETSKASVGERDELSHTDAARNWTLSDLEAMALENNPTIRQAEASVRKSIGYRDQVGRHPNPTVGYTASQLADAGTDQHVAYFEQDIVTGQKLTRNRRVLAYDVQARQWEVHTQRLRVQSDVRTAFYAALAAQTRRDLALKYLDKSREWHRHAERRKEAGEGSNLEIGQTNILQREIEMQLSISQVEMRGAWQKLVAVVGITDLPPGTLEGDLTLPISDVATMWDDKILEGSPELEVARAEVCRAQANLDRQEAQTFSNWTVMLGAGRDNGTNSGMINAQLGVPIPIHNRNQGNIIAARAEWSRACENLRRVEQSIRARIADLQATLDTATARAVTYQDGIIPQAEETLRLTEEAFTKQGAAEFLEVLLARKTTITAQMEYITACLERAQARATLESFALTGGLETVPDTSMDAGIRDQALSGQ